GSLLLCRLFLLFTARSWSVRPVTPPRRVFVSISTPVAVGPYEYLPGNGGTRRASVSCHADVGPRNPLRRHDHRCGGRCPPPVRLWSRPAHDPGGHRAHDRRPRLLSGGHCGAGRRCAASGARVRAGPHGSEDSARGVGPRGCRRTYTHSHPLSTSFTVLS